MTIEKTTIQDLANALAEKQGMSFKDAELFIKGVFELIEEALITEKYVKVKGLGIFKLVEVDSRESINVNTGERIEIQGHSKISFTPETSLKELINKPFSHFETVILNEATTFDDILSESEDEEEIPASIIEDQIEEILQENIVNSTKEEIIESTEEDSIEPISSIETETETETETTTGTEVESVVVEEEELIAEIPEEERPTELIQEKEISQEKTSKGLIFITILLILLIIGGFYWMFFSQESENEIPPQQETISLTEPEEKVMEMKEIGEKPQEKKQESTLKVEEKEIIPETLEKNIPTPVVKEEKIASLADTTKYRIVGTKTTHTLQKGETIIRVSLKYFGGKNFWPYIAKHNEKTIKDANNVPIGTKLLIPKLTPKN